MFSHFGTGFIPLCFVFILILKSLKYLAEIFWILLILHHIRRQNIPGYFKFGESKIDH